MAAVANRSLAVPVLVAVLVVLAGCSAVSDGGEGRSPTAAGTPMPPTGTPTAVSTPTTTGTAVGGTDPTATPTDADRDPSGPTDPPTDRIGWESGYWYDEALSVDGADGYNRTEIDRVVARTMARIERIREREFREPVGVEVITREQYRDRRVFEFEPDPARDQFWEALFVVGEDTDSATALEGVYSGNVAGYYSQGDIVIVSRDPRGVELSRATLAHELTHALQDQTLGLTYSGGDSDEVLAFRAISEGEANYVMDEYLRRCGQEWSCIPPVSRSAGASGANQGVFLSVYLPYSDGPTLVEALVERGGWEAVDRAWKKRPASTEQVIHPEKYPDEKPVDVAIEDRSGPGWKPIGRRETAGEANLFAAFVANGVVPEDHLRTDDRRYNYSHPITEGWGGDTFLAYRNGDEFGYVFKTVWDTRKDARQFLGAYRTLLDRKGASQVRENVYRIPDSNPYGDAFRVVRRGKTVLIVNAPTVDALDAVHRVG